MSKASKTTTCTRCGAAPGAPCRYPSKADRDALGRLLPGTVWTGRPTPRSHPGRAAARIQPVTTCQICARPIEAGTGVIAHHGYQRPGGGWQTASCMGARHLPYEQSCDQIPAAIESIFSYVARTEEALQRHHDVPPETLVEAGLRRGITPVVFRRPEDFDPDHLSGSFRYDQRYELRYVNLRFEMHENIKRAKYDAQFLRDRLAAWRPRMGA